MGRIEVEGGKFADIELTGIEVTEEGGVVSVWEGQAPDMETAEAAGAILADRRHAKSWRVEMKDEDGSTKKSFYFSEATWKAPWQPKGPKPNWQEADPAEPIN